MNRKFAAISVSCLAAFSLAAGFFALSRARARTEPPRAQAAASVVNTDRVRAGYGQLPLSFEVNAGQTDARVKFLARARAYTLFLTDRDATLRLLQPSAATKTLPPWARATGKGSAKVSGAVVRFSLAGSTSPSAMEALEPQPGRSNYFVGNDPARWHRDIPHYARVKYREVYPGVDVVYYGNQGQLESDYIVAPGADPRQIALKIEGADALTLNPRDGVTLSTKAGDLLLQQPIAYQQNGAQRVAVAANYVRRGARLFGIHVGPYDTQRPLIIDPNIVNPALGYSTYLGGTADNLPFGIAADSTGFAYVTGFTASSDFPI